MTTPTQPTTLAETPTPRTDMAECENFPGTTPIVSAHFARQLERELATSLAERDNYRRSVENAHLAMDESRIIKPREVTHQGLTPRIKSVLKRLKEANAREAELVRIKDHVEAELAFAGIQTSASANELLALRQRLEAVEKNQAHKAIEALYAQAHEAVDFFDSNEFSMDMEVSCAIEMLHRDLTAEREKVKALERLLKRTLSPLQMYAANNPRWESLDLGKQDPSGVHETLEIIESALTPPTKEEKA